MNLNVTERSNATDWAYMQEGENARGGAVTHLDIFLRVTGSTKEKVFSAEN